MNTFAVQFADIHVKFDYRAVGFALLWSISVLFDCTAFLLTVWQTLSIRPKSGKGIQTRLYDLLLRDGVMYFA